MKHKILVGTLFCLAASVVFGQAQPQPGAAPATIPAGGKPISAEDVSPPVPIIRGVRKAMVEEQAAQVLTPEELEMLKRITAKARETEPFQYPNKFIAKPVIRSIEIHPGDEREPRMVRLFLGTVTPIAFSDLNGQPWLVKSVSIDCTQFDDSGFTCKDGSGQQKAPEPTNIVKIQPKKPYAYGNIVVELEGLPIPITMMLSTGQSEENDIRIEARVAGRNPNAKPLAMTLEKMPEHDPMMQNFLDGVPPQGAQRLKLGGGNGEAWVLNGALYVRTRMSIINPAFKDHAGTADGTHVYKFYSAVPTLMASVNGKPVFLYVSGY